jgi:hypothetical protein
MDRKQIRDLIENWYEAHKRSDFAFFERMLADDVEWTMHGPPQAFPVENSLYGKKAMLEALKQINAALYVVLFRTVPWSSAIPAARWCIASRRSGIAAATSWSATSRSMTASTCWSR